MQFDRAPQVVAAEDRVVLGNSVDGTVTCIDATNGGVAWTFYTEGPVRFAPVIWQDRLLVGSDDGFLYALDLHDGHLLWKHRGGPTRQTVLGNQQMISKWPVRGGPVVADGVVYFAAGIWPSDGIYVVALDADTGKVRWQNTDCGQIDMPQPHPGANAKSGVSAQGYLVVSGDHLFVPTGRAVPASFDRHTGNFEYFHLQKYGHNGESLVMVIGDTFFNGGIQYDVRQGLRLSQVGGGELAATDSGIARCFRRQMGEFRWQQETKPDRKGKPQTVETLVPLWTHEAPWDGTAVVSAGNQVVLGGDGAVGLFDTTTQHLVWQAKVDGTAYGLAVANGRLLVSTDRGTLHCFAPSAAASVSPVPVADAGQPAGTEANLGDVADQIIEHSGVGQGYCLDLGCGDGALAAVLAKRTELQIVAVDADPANIQLARRRLVAEGLYGGRVVVLQRTLSDTGLPPYFANLVVSRRSLDQPVSETVVAEAKRVHALVEACCV